MYLENYRLEVPNSIIILKDNDRYMIYENEHYVFKTLESGLFIISHHNGKKINETIHYTQYDLFEIFFHTTVYKELSLESFNKLKAFL